MEVKFKFNNGEEVKDLVSGFTGIIDCCAIWLNGCVRYSIQPKVKEGETHKKPDSIWMDEQSMEKISDGVNSVIESAPTGGPSFESDSARM